jgi:uncharacterized protein YndB with AHSA1/START domain
MKRDLRFEAEYGHAPEKVWRALTEPAAIARWLMQNDFAARPGHRFQFRAKPVGGWDGIVRGEVLEADPPKRLVYTWTSNMIDTRVIWTLTPTSNGTRVVLEHTGFEGIKGMMASVFLGGGWKGMVSKAIPAVVAALDSGTLESIIPPEECREDMNEVRV